MHISSILLYRVYFIVLTNFMHIILHNCIRNYKFEQRQFFLSLSLTNKLKKKDPLSKGYGNNYEMNTKNNNSGTSLTLPQLSQQP